MISFLPGGQWLFQFSSAQRNSHPSGNHQHHSIEMQGPFFNLQSNARLMHHYCKSNVLLYFFNPLLSLFDSGHTGLMCFGESDDKSHSAVRVGGGGLKRWCSRRGLHPGEMIGEEKCKYSLCGSSSLLCGFM